MVFARLTGYPWWPAVVARSPVTGSWCDEAGRSYVLFANEVQGAWVGDDDIRALPSDPAAELESCIQENKTKFHRFRTNVLEALDLCEKYMASGRAGDPSVLTAVNCQLSSALLRPTAVELFPSLIVDSAAVDEEANQVKQKEKSFPTRRSPRTAVRRRSRADGDRRCRDGVSTGRVTRQSRRRSTSSWNYKAVGEVAIDSLKALDEYVSDPATDDDSSADEESVSEQPSSLRRSSRIRSPTISSSRSSPKPTARSSRSGQSLRNAFAKDAGRTKAGSLSRFVTIAKAESTASKRSNIAGSRTARLAKYVSSNDRPLSIAIRSLERVLEGLKKRKGSKSAPRGGGAVEPRMMNASKSPGNVATILREDSEELMKACQDFAEAYSGNAVAAGSGLERFMPRAKEEGELMRAAMIVQVMIACENKASK